MKKIIPLLLTAALLTSCAKLTEMEFKTVKATIVAAEQTPLMMMPVQSGKTVTYTTFPARYEITIKYDDISTTINDEDLYNQYKNSVGDVVECELITEHFDDGTISHELKIKK